MYRQLFMAMALCLCGPALAQTPDTVFLDQLTWVEARDAISCGKTTIIIPTGGTEQGGPHVVLGKHNYRVPVFADAIARQLGNALVAPTMAYVPEGGLDPATGHMRFPGTITLPDPICRQVLEYAARSLKLHGFKNIVFLGDSGGNQPGQTAVAATLNAEWAGSDVRVHTFFNYYRGDTEGDAALMMQRGIRKEEIGDHADVRDTSLLLATAPALVRMNKLQAGDGKNGVVGDPRHASAEIGRVLIEKTVTRTVKEIQDSIAKR